MFRPLSALLSFAAALSPASLALAGSGAAPSQEAPLPFPPSTAIAESLSPDALAALDRLVQSFVDDGEIVGGELLVLKNGKQVLHRGYGFRDREAEQAMEPGTLFCVRSMTKPLVGTAIRMLVEDDRLELRDPAAKYLSAFDVPGKREITIDQLLHHTSGLPMSLIMGQNPRELTGVRAVADLGGACELEFEPGTAFRYSDQGTDTLTAIVEVVTGAPAEDFVQARILGPFGMVDSACILRENSPLRTRSAAKYAGSPGAWTRYWKPDDAPLFPVFLGSQSLYSTTVDYARFLQFWLDRGRVGRERLLRAGSVRKTLAPGPFPLSGSSGMPDTKAEYGSLMQLWMRTVPAAEGEPRAEPELVAFGHTGSDGTHAWAFPEQDAMVLYFTQSRGTTTGVRVEEQLGDLLLGVPFDPNQAAPPFDDYLGHYWEGEGDLYRSIVLDGDDLALEIVGKAVVPLRYAGGERWKLKPQPGTVLEFQRDDAGSVTGYRIGEHEEFRFEPASDLPAAVDVAARAAQAHRVEALAKVGVIRSESSFEIESLKLAGKRTAWLVWPDRWRVDEQANGERAQVAYDGTTVRRTIGDAAPTVLEGREAADARGDSLFVRFGDWRTAYPELRVIQRLHNGDEDVLVLRTGGLDAPQKTFFVDAATGQLGRCSDVVLMPQLGAIGRQIQYSDFREFHGARLPFATSTTLSHPMIGRISAMVERMEAGVELPEDGFGLGQ